MFVNFSFGVPAVTSEHLCCYCQSLNVFDVPAVAFSVAGVPAIAFSVAVVPAVADNYICCCVMGPFHRIDKR